MSVILTPEFRQAVVLDIAKLAREKYVYPEVGEKLATSIQAKLQEGGYDEISQAGQLAMTLTEDLRALSNDRHWSVVHDPQQTPAHIDPETEEDQAQLARWLIQARRRNFGFEKVELLAGNIGYVDLREFAPSEHAGETAVAAMGFVANCDALIFDLRQNHGGYPSMIQLITSYLYEGESRHINTFYYRPTDDYQQFWTFPHVPGRRLPEVPVGVARWWAKRPAAPRIRSPGKSFKSSSSWHCRTDVPSILLPRRTGRALASNRSSPCSKKTRSGRRISTPWHSSRRTARMSD
ncbi:MAG: S41 family peptidase [Anaerolineae bacterium]